MESRPGRFALAQLDPRVGDLEGNAARILAAARDASRAGAGIVICPELSLVGYPPLDLLDEPEFVERAIRAVPELARQLGSEAPSIDVVFGAVAEAGVRTGKRLSNVAVLASGGRIVATRAKSLLPSYDVFDEDRWFVPAEENAPIDALGTRLGLTICEDAWNDEDFWPHRIYPRDPVAELARAGARVLVNLSASPYHRGKAREREAMLRASAARHVLPLLFVNQVGANDELVFDGGSAAFDGRGRVLARAARFREDLVVVELDAEGAGEPTALPELPEHEGAADLRQALALGVRDYVEKTGFRTVVIGLSGGIDSAVVAAVAVDALGPSRVEGVLMPGPHSSPGSVTDALDLAGRLGIATRTIGIVGMFDACRAALWPQFPDGAASVTEENLQARLRGVVLMAISNQFGSLVLSTGNKSELAVGYCTLYGDMNGGLAVLGDCYKGWVYQLARAFNAEREVIPRAIIDKPPSAELRPGQLDQDSLPPYDVLDRILEGLVERRKAPSELAAEGLPLDLVLEIRQRMDRNEYKRRQAPPILRVTPRAFGTGRRLPLARG